MKSSFCIWVLKTPLNVVKEYSDLMLKQVRILKFGRTMTRGSWRIFFLSSGTLATITRATSACRNFKDKVCKTYRCPLSKAKKCFLEWWCSFRRCTGVPNGFGRGTCETRLKFEINTINLRQTCATEGICGLGNCTDAITIV